MPLGVANSAADLRIQCDCYRSEGSFRPCRVTGTFVSNMSVHGGSGMNMGVVRTCQRISVLRSATGRAADQHRRARAQRGLEPVSGAAAAAGGPRGHPRRRRLGRRHRRCRPGARCPSIITVLQARRGKGNALAAGFARVTGDIVVMFDADGSADPDEIVRFVEALKSGADFAKGSRFTDGRRLGRHHADPPAGQRVPERDLQPRLRDPVQRPVLRLQRLLGRPDPAARPAGPRPAGQGVGPDGLGRRLRDRDGHQLPFRRVRRRRSPRCPRSSGCGCSATRTSTRSPTGCASSRRSSPSGAVPAPRQAGGAGPSRRRPRELRVLEPISA